MKSIMFSGTSEKVEEVIKAIRDGEKSITIGCSRNFMEPYAMIIARKILEINGCRILIVIDANPRDEAGIMYVTPRSINRSRGMLKDVVIYSVFNDDKIRSLCKSIINRSFIGVEIIMEPLLLSDDEKKLCKNLLDKEK